MKIIDSSTLINCIEKGIILSDVYYTTGDLSDEIELIEIIHEQKLINIEEATKLPNYSEPYYLRQYALMLNKYSGYSFTAMRGFGDVAILALVKSKLDNFGKPDQTTLELFGEMDNKITIITNDTGLSKRIKNEFKNKVIILDSNDIK